MRRLATISARRRLTSVATAIVAAVGLVALLSAREFGAVLIFLVSYILLYGAWRWLAAGDHWVLAVFMLALSVRVAIIGAFNALAISSGQVPNLFGDEAGYFEWSVQSANAILGGADPRTVFFGRIAGANPFIDTGAVLVLAFGKSPVLMKALNAALAVMSAVVAYDLVRSLFDQRAGRAAALLIAFFPSLLLWSVTNLREPWIVLLLLVSVWSLERTRRRPHWLWLATGVYALVLIEGIRGNLFFVMSVPFVAGAWLALARVRDMKLRSAYWGVTFLALGVLMEVLSGKGYFGSALLRTSTLQYLSEEHAFMALGARTRFVPEPDSSNPIVLTPGVVTQIEAFPTSIPASGATPVPTSSQVSIPTVQPSTTPAPTPSPLATPTAAPTATPVPSALVVKPGQAIVLVQRGTSPSPKPNTVFVRPGDSVLLESQAASAQNGPSPFLLNFGDENFVQAQESNALPFMLRMASLVPRGLLYVLAAPFPGLTKTVLEFWSLGEMVPWFLVLAAAGATVYVRWRRWPELFPLVSAAALLLVLMAIVEGNVGTLVRHRSMLIPFMIALAAPTLTSWWDVVLARVTARVLHLAASQRRYPAPK